MNISNITKFLTVGVAAGLTSVAHAFNAISIAATSVAVSGSHSIQKATEIATSPEALNIFQRNPIVSIICGGTVMAAGFLTIGYLTFSSLSEAYSDTSTKQNINNMEDKDSIMDKIKNFREKNTSTSLKMKP